MGRRPATADAHRSISWTPSFRIGRHADARGVIAAVIGAFHLGDCPASGEGAGGLEGEHHAFGA
jgi:hypothetical protein